MTGVMNIGCYTHPSEVEMAGRYTYSPYEVEPLQYQYGQMGQSGPRRFFAAVGRFFYRVIVLALIVGAVGGVLFALYRNDVLLNVARGAGVEAQYKSFEQRIGAPGWGTPRSIDLPKDLPAAPGAAAENGAEDKQPETVRAAATVASKTVDSATSTPDGLPIVSFDSLPTASGKTAPAKAAAEAVSLDAVPSAPARNARVEPARATRAEPAPSRKRSAKAEPKATEVTRSIPLPKPKPEPVAKAEPAPKPEPPAPKPPAEDHTKARASDNPLQAAIRASMAGKKPAE
jgi:hypothetical protein